LKLLKTFALTYGVLLTCGIIFYLVTKNNQQLFGLNRLINPAEWILAAIIVGVICFGFAVLNALMDIEQAKQQSTAMRNKLLQYRDKVNYQNELDRIRGYLSSYDTRFPIGTVKRLRDRGYELKKIGAQITK
jgi:hypothetical protein